MALENNLGIQAERLAPQINTLEVAGARAAYAPVLFSNFFNRNSTQPPSTFITGAGSLLTTESLTQDGGLAQNIPWGGGNYSLSLSGGKVTTSATDSRFNPQLSSNLSARGRAAAAPQLQDRQLPPADRDHAEQPGHRRHRAARAGHADVPGGAQRLFRPDWRARRAARSRSQSLELAQGSLKSNRTKVEVGTLAPIDIIEAEAEVASNEEAVINAEARIKTVEDRLRYLILNPSQPDFWTTRIEPTDAPSLTPIAIDVDAAIANALAQRTDIARLKKQLDNVDVGIKFAQNQKMPGLDLTANYNVIGVAGTQFEFGQGFPPPVLNSSIRSFQDALGDVSGRTSGPGAWRSHFSYPLGTSQADAALASNRLQRQQGAVNLRDLELQVATGGPRRRTPGRNQPEARRGYPEGPRRAERRLEAEKKRMTVGLSTTFQLFQAQRDLARQRQQEVNAMIDYNRSVINFESIQIAPSGGGAADAAGPLDR